MSRSFPKLSVVVLAAGLSRRFGAENKLLQEVGGKSLLWRSLVPFLDLGFREVMVVLGHESQNVKQAVQDLPVRFVENPDFESGMGASVAFGIRSVLDSDLDGVLISLGDLPELRSDEVEAICSEFYRGGGDRILVPRHRGKRGHPVCFPHRTFLTLKNLSGDEGARKVIQSDESTVSLELAHHGCVKDVDTKG